MTAADCFDLPGRRSGQLSSRRCPVRPTLAMLLLGFSIVCPIVGEAGIWHVPVDAPTIQAGIDSAAAGDTVEVACGTYYEYGIVMKSGVCLRGETGLPGCVTVDGQGLGQVLVCEYLDSTTVIEGLTATDGAALEYDYGGGMYCNRCEFEVRDCVFSGNSSDLLGGGVYCFVSPMTFVRCEFRDNISGNSGGGVSCNSMSPCTFVDCEFDGNSALYGAGIYTMHNTVSLSGCVISNNSGYRGGGLCSRGNEFSGKALPILVNCTLFGNSCTGAGGGMYFQTYYADTAEITNCIVAFSRAGAAVACVDSADALLMCSDVYGNAGGDWTGCIAGQAGVSGNFSADPVFCDTLAGDYGLHVSSPCADASGCGLVGALPVGCGVYLVCPDGSGDFLTIQDAIDASGYGEVVELCDWTFTGAGNRDLDFLGKAITVRSRSGDAGACVIDCEGGPGDAHRGFIFQNGEDTTSVLEAVTVMNAYSSQGGGIYCNGSSPRVSNCVFRDNHVYSSTGSRGGGICCISSSAVLAHCTFDGNSAQGSGYFLGVGGGLYSTLSSLKLLNCTFSGNSADGYGGGMMCENSSPAIDNTIIAFTSSGGGFACSGTSDPVISCCSLYANTGGNWICTAGSDTMNQSFSEDPLFCDRASGNLYVENDSPCAPSNNACGLLIGAWPVGCPGASVPDTDRPAVAEIFLGMPYPNPFGPATGIAYAIPGGSGECKVTLSVYNALGQRVKTLVDAVQPAGYYTVTWNGADSAGAPVASGVYFYRLTWNGESRTQRVVLIR
jgi:hypothetical protein